MQLSGFSGRPPRRLGLAGGRVPWDGVGAVDKWPGAATVKSLAAAGVVAFIATAFAREDAEMARALPQCEPSNTSLPICGAILPGVDGSAVHLGNVG